MIRTGRALIVSQAMCDRCPFENVRCGESVKAMQRVRAPAAPQEGPGTELHKLLGKLGFKEAPGCACRKRMATMNAKGAQWCLDNLDTIVGWLREEHERRKSLLPFSAGLARLIVRKAIRRAAALAQG